MKKEIAQIQNQINLGFFSDDPLENESPQDAYFRKFGKIE